MRLPNGKLRELPPIAAGGGGGGKVQRLSPSFDLEEAKAWIVRSFIHSIKADKTPRASMLWSSPGSGKTSICGQIASETAAALKEEVTFVPIATASSEPWDIQGALTRSNEGPWSEYVPLEWIYQASVKGGGPMVVLLDDLPTADPQTQAACFKLIHELRAGNCILRNNVLLIAAGNRTTDASGAHAMLKAMSNRLRHLDIRLDKDCFVRHAMSSGFHPLVAMFINNHPQYLSTFNPNTSDEAFATPRSWENTSDCLWEFQIVPEGVVDLKLILKQISAIVGEEAADAFVTYSELSKDIIPAGIILKDPKGAPIPDPNRVDISWATVTGLLYYMNDLEAAKAAFVYADRLPADVAIHLATNVLDLAKRAHGFKGVMALSQSLNDCGFWKENSVLTRKLHAFVQANNGA